ncbi:MAG TPA: NAD(P)H-dependent glycerol-3-phosphate dehydrogenase, partial [Acidimicrobiales bacterium]|nr:NAD(P)H-dependent glycerol-3-phosphate dehydrogenase [Acidimicrobiales bacterium]
LGLAGNGDLIATCSSPQSRNFRVGRMLADGLPIDAIVEQMTMVAEGVATAPVVVALAERVGIELPIASAVAALLSGRHRPEELVTQLMTRDPKPEAAGLELTQATTDGRSR